MAAIRRAVHEVQESSYWVISPIGNCRVMMDFGPLSFHIHTMPQTNHNVDPKRCTTAHNVIKRLCKYPQLLAFPKDVHIQIIQDKETV